MTDVRVPGAPGNGPHRLIERVVRACRDGVATRRGVVTRRFRAGRGMTQRFRAERGMIASSGLLIVVAGAVLAAALNAEGYRTPELKLHDAGVWISWSTQTTIGRTNTQIAQVDVHTVLENAAEFDLLQADEIVLVHRRSGGSGSLSSVEGRTALEKEGVATLPGDAQVGMGGPANAEPTTAVLGPQGEVWTAPGAGLVGRTLVASDDGAEVAPPAATVAGATDLAVGTDGLARVFSPAKGEVLAYDAAGAMVVTTKVASEVDDHEFDLTVVGSTPVVLDRTEQLLMLPGGELVDISDVGGHPEIQQPGPENDVVLVATDVGLFGVPLDGGLAQKLAGLENAGPAQPVYMRGCAWAGWSGVPTVARRCETDTEASISALTSFPANKPLKFRTNRGKLVINELDGGRAYALTTGDPEEVDWRQALSEADDQNDRSDNQAEMEKPERDPEAKPPVANDDLGSEGFATRVDRAVVVDPLRNDSDPNEDLIVIESVSEVQPAGAVVQVVQDGLAVQVTPSPGSGETVRFGYTINDGTFSASAKVEVVIRSPGENARPACFRSGPQETYVVAGASITHNVLAEATDPDGDTMALVTPIGLASSQGTVSADPDGTVVYTPPGTGFVGESALPFRITDEFGGVVDCVLTAHVSAPGSLNREPVVRGDHASTLVDREVVVDVLVNDSDADGDPLRVVGVVPSPAAEITVDAQQRIHVLPGIAGVIQTVYSITDGPHVVTGLLRVDVREQPQQEPPIAVRDDVILRPGVPAVVEAVANDIDINGEVLVIHTIDVPEETGLTVEVLEYRFLRITYSGPSGLLPAATQFRYTVTDGFGASIGTVVVRPGATTELDQSPVAVPDDVAIRAGTIAALDVLRNDRDPEGGRLQVRLLPAEEQEPRLGALMSAGDVFEQGDLLRFRAPAEPGTYRVGYRAVDPAGYSSATYATVHVLAADTANQGPRPSDLVARTVAGGETTIPIPVVTMDPDGDAVTLLGIGDTVPAHGSVVAVGSDRLTYLPDRYDTTADGVPDGFFGTDTFTYRVRDAKGAEAQGTIRVGVAPPATSNTRPVAIDDERRVAQGAVLRVDVVRNDSDPDGDNLTIDETAGLGLPRNPPFEAVIEDGRIVLSAGPGMKEGDVAELTYTVTDGILSDSGLLRVIVTAEGNQPPLALDDRGPTTATGDRVTVAVLDNDVDPDGEHDDLHVVEVSPPGAAVPSADGRSVTVTMATAPVEVVYTVEDAGGGTARAVLRVPLADGLRSRPIAAYDEETMRQGGGPVTVAVLDNDIVSPNTAKQLFDVSNFRGGTCAVDGNRVTFTAAPDFVGLGGCAYEMGDGPGDDPATLRAGGMLGVNVERAGNTPPTFVSQSLEVVADDKTVTDLRPGARDPDDGHLDAMRFSDIKGEAGGVTASFEGSVLTVKASRNAVEGTVVNLTFAVTDPDGAAVEGSVMITVSEFSGALAVAVADTARTFEDLPTAALRVLDNDQRAEGSGDLKIVEITQPQGGRAESTADSVTFTPNPGFFGMTTFTYTIDDGTEQIDRRVTGTITVEVVGRPAAPPAPAVVRESRAITLTWGVPAANGAPITKYLVRANGPGGGTRETSANTLRYDGLTNGAQYTFQIAAINEATIEKYGASVPDDEFSPPSEIIIPNERPSTPDAPSAAFVPTGEEIDVTWANPGGDGTPVEEYLLEISPPPASGSQQKFPARGAKQTERIDGLTNGVPYTFRVKAFNTLQADLKGESEWSAASSPETPAKPPEPPLQPQIVERGDRYIVVGWEAPADNGDAIGGYVVEYNNNGASVGETAELAPSPREVRIDTDNGESYTFKVKARNKAGFSTYSSASAPAVSYGVPGPTASVTATEGDQSSVVGVGGTVDENGDSIDNWQYRVSTNGGGFPGDPDAGWQAFAGPGSSVSAPNGSTYQFQVRACNARGCADDPGATSNAVSPYGAPTTPSVSGSNNGSDITWNWSASNGNGRTIINYEITVQPDGVSQVVPGNQLTYTRSGYTDDSSTHTLYVVAISNGSDPSRNRSGTGQASVTRPSPPPPPPPPTNPTVQARLGGISNGSACSNPGTSTCRYLEAMLQDFAPNSSHTVSCQVVNTAGNWQQVASNTVTVNASGDWGWGSAGGCYVDAYQARVVVDGTYESNVVSTH